MFQGFEACGADLEEYLKDFDVCEAYVEECFEDLRLVELISRNVLGVDARGADFEEWFADLKLAELILGIVSRIWGWRGKEAKGW